MKQTCLPNVTSTIPNLAPAEITENARPQDPLPIPSTTDNGPHKNPISPANLRSSTSSGARIAELKRQNKELRNQLQQQLASAQSADAQSRRTAVARGRSRSPSRHDLPPHRTKSPVEKQTPPGRPRSGTGFTQHTSNSAAPNFKAKPPKAFNGQAKDLRSWIVEFDKYLALIHTQDPELQSTLAINFTEGSLQRRLTTIKMTDRHNPIFYNWNDLKMWLEENYGLPDPHQKASSLMATLQMRPGRPVQQFINDFETYAADLQWNDGAFADTFCRKLLATILMQVHAMNPQGLPTILAG
ncbi:MAG: hypothetical protein M1837_004050 [Sclerophora amabilis]|nr:MAG: hypothetical protein M1837_004050 [Sclerophora amabilis]